MIHVSHNVEQKLSLLNLFIKANARSQSNPRVETFFCKNYYVEANCGKKFSLQCIINVINFENLP